MAGRGAEQPDSGTSPGDGQMSSLSASQANVPPIDLGETGVLPPAPAAAAVQLDHAQAQIGGHTVWSEVNINIAEGEFAAILGPNGSGKTTLLRVLLGELALTAGTVSVLGAAPGGRKRQIGYLPQRRHFDA